MGTVQGEDADDKKEDDARDKKGPTKKPAAKATAKAKAKPSVQSKSKGKPNEPPMKRPASQATLKEQAETWQHLSSDDEKDTAGQDDSEGSDDESAASNKGKGVKRAKLYAAGGIPQHIVHMFDVESRKPPKPRKFKTKIINSLFQKTEGGEYKLVAA